MNINIKNLARITRFEPVGHLKKLFFSFKTRLTSRTSKIFTRIPYTLFSVAITANELNEIPLQQLI